MANIHTLNEINNGAPLVSGNKLGDSPFNRYPSSQTELENQRLKYDLDIALSSGIQLGTRNSLLMKNNESFSERVCQLEDEAKELKNEINQKEISLLSANSEIATKSEEIQALQSEIKELEMKYFLAQKDLSEMDSLRQELAQTRQNVELKNVDLDLKEYELSEKKDELMR
jgi:chromosome segregation ATPase